MDIVIITLITALVVVASASHLHKKKLKIFLTTPLPIDTATRDKASATLGIDGAAVVGVSVFDVLYNAIKLDTRALSGMTRLHQSQDFANLSELMTFMKEEIIRLDDSGNIARHIVHKYKGYTGEEQVFDALARSNQSIDIPKSGTHPGLDVTIDGKDYNIKLTDNPQYIQSHLDKHPDIDVITNREMEVAFKGNPRVAIDPSLSSQEIFHTTKDTLEGLSDMGDFLDQVPYLALAINTAKNGHRLYKGEVDWKTAGEHTAIDTAATATGSLIGGKIGLKLGLILAPATGGVSAFVLPTAGIFVGGVAGVFGGKKAGGWLKGRHLRSAQERLDTASTSLREAFLCQFEEIKAKVRTFFDGLGENATRESKNGNALRNALFPSAKNMFFRLAKGVFTQEKIQSLQMLDSLHEEIKSSEPQEGGKILIAQGPSIYMGVEPLPALYKVAAESLISIEIEKEKLGL